MTGAVNELVRHEDRKFLRRVLALALLMAGLFASGMWVLFNRVDSQGLPSDVKGWADGR
jgi:hypothetical protein